MKKILISFGIFALLILSTSVLAQSSAVHKSSKASGDTVSCFDYYKFGSVHASLETKNYKNTSGTTVNFFGEIKNENSYPIVDGKLFVKVMRANDSYDKTGGQDEVDSFIVKEGISIPANSSVPINFDWKIPAYAISGEYQISTYFLVDNSFNMSGLPFTTDIVGGVVKFAVIGEQKEGLLFDRTNITLNDGIYYTVAFPPVIPLTSDANVVFTLKNETNQTQQVPVTLELYEWDGQAQKNLLDTQQTTYLIEANSSIAIPYATTDTEHSVYYIVAKAQYKDAKSEVSVRFGRQGIQEPRINFSTFTQYPFVKGEENSLITCVHSTGESDAEYGKVVTSILDYKGNVIHTSTYEGKITGAIQGLLSKFTPKANYKDLKIETKIYDKDNNIVDEISVDYACSDLSADCKEPNKFFNFTTLITTLIVIILVLLIVVFRHRLKKKDLIVMFALPFIVGALFMPNVGEAKSVRWTYLMAGEWHNNPDDYCPVACGGQSYTVNPYFQIDYYGIVKNLTTSQMVTDGSAVNAGDTLRFIFGSSDTNFSEDYKDIFWFKTGYMTGSPYGEWVKDASEILYKDFSEFNNDLTAWSNYMKDVRGKYATPVPADYIEASVANCYIVNKGRISNLKQVCEGLRTSLPSYNNSLDYFIQFNVNPPSKQLNQGSALTCGTFDSTNHYIDCTVNSVVTATPVTVDFIYEKTFGIYYENLLGGNINTFWSPLLEGESGLFGNMKIDIPSQKIPFTLNVQPAAACSSSNTPTKPIITGPSSVAINAPATFSFNSDNVSTVYKIDWGNGAGWESTTNPVNKTWTTTGVKSIRVQATNANSLCSVESEPFQVNVLNSLTLNPISDLSASGSCNSVTLNWTGNGADSYDIFRKTSGTFTKVGSTTFNSYTDDTVSNDTAYTYKIFATKTGYTDVESNIVNITPVCSTEVTLNVVERGTGSGTVSGLGISCGVNGSDCTQDFTPGTSVTLTANANPADKNKFTAWHGACSGVTTTTCTLIMSGDKIVEAEFNLIDPLVGDPSIVSFKFNPQIANSDGVCGLTLNASNVKSCNVINYRLEKIVKTFFANPPTGGNINITNETLPIGAYDLECTDINDVLFNPPNIDVISCSSNANVIEF